ncbi:MAG: pantoate--beta-alanine ligase [Phycisphaerales bacterium]
MRILTHPDELAAWPDAVLVPTMGALHVGHAELFRVAGQASGGRLPVIASVFVNPKQFNEDVDFTTYPRDLDADAAIAERAGVAAVFAPSVEVVYPEGEPLHTPPVPEVGRFPGLEDRYRPGHLEGVVQVVARLFDLVQPRGAIFGEKDFQQLLLVRAMVNQVQTDTTRAERWPGLEVLAAPTVREDDGVALSSRNRRLDEASRAAARGIPLALQAAHAAQHPQTAESIMRRTLDEHGLEVEYAVVRDSRTLQPIDDFREPSRGLIAAWIGGVRLIDNRNLAVWK